MINNLNYTIKIAESDQEFEMIHRLNYKTFVDEIPQHQENDIRLLIDKFHDENTYIIALHGDKLAGMLAVRGIRPFSLDLKIPNLDSYLPENNKVCEIRLLAIEKEYRGGFIFYRLLKRLADYFREYDYNYAIISGTIRQQKLYMHIGFKPFYELVGKEGAYYQPMYITIDMLDKGLVELLK